MPILFCPYCANLLILSRMDAGSGGGNRLECRTCPYQHAIDMPIYSRKNFTRREKEDVFGGPGAWDNAQKGRVQCPTADCSGVEAAFFQVQIRSADEPMTTFYKVGVFIPPPSVGYVITGCGADG
ncbi:a056bacb-c6d1-4e32-b938-80fd9f910b96 [Thermothielavioides terrestris]|nr:a056bacb-c6d1-4e32-b938-80fd9f910b96 [Thermothielavioides terrestris]